MLLLLLTACEPHRTYHPTTGEIYVVEGGCENNGMVINVTDDAVNLLGLEICTADGCDLNPPPGLFWRDGAMVHLRCDGYGSEAWLRARFLRLDPR